MRPPSFSSVSPASDPALFAAISLTSFSALLLELALTRLFSVVLFYHFAFLAISVALLGLGAGGVFAYLCESWLTGFETRRLAATLASGNAIAILFTLLVALHVPVSLDLSRGNLFHLTEMYLTSAVPFFFTGLIFSVVFAREAQQVTRLYGADLAGGAGLPGCGSVAELARGTQCAFVRCIYFWRCGPGVEAKAHEMAMVSPRV